MFIIYLRKVIVELKKTVTEIFFKFVVSILSRTNQYKRLCVAENSKLLCIMSHTYFICVCFSGLFCEFSPPMVLPRTSPCDNHDCLNGAQCVVIGPDPRCQCLHGYEGERCETLVSVNFVSRESYLQLPSDLLSPETNISLQVPLFGRLLTPL